MIATFFIYKNDYGNSWVCKIQLQIHRMQKDIDLPSYAKSGDAGLDIRASKDVRLDPGETGIVPTGLRFAIPDGYVGLVWDRSGLAAKNSITTMAGVIDSGYRGEIQVVLKNLGKESFMIEKGMRIAQMLIQPVANSIPIKEVDELPESHRKADGFGSTGLH